MSRPAAPAAATLQAFDDGGERGADGETDSDGDGDDDDDAAAAATAAEPAVGFDDASAAVAPSSPPSPPVAAADAAADDNDGKTSSGGDGRSATYSGRWSDPKAIRPSAFESGQGGTMVRCAARGGDS